MIHRVVATIERDLPEIHMIRLGDRRYSRQVAGQSDETRIEGRQIILERVRVVTLGIDGDEQDANLIGVAAEFVEDVRELQGMKMMRSDRMSRVRSIALTDLHRRGQKDRTLLGIVSHDSRVIVTRQQRHQRRGSLGGARRHFSCPPIAVSYPRFSPCPAWAVAIGWPGVRGRQVTLQRC
jgi:hypothetical protein